MQGSQQSAIRSPAIRGVEEERLILTCSIHTSAEALTIGETRGIWLQEIYAIINVAKLNRNGMIQRQKCVNIAHQVVKRLLI